MKLPTIALENITTLTFVYRITIPPDYQDYNGHMNIRWYLGIFDDAGLPLYDLLSLTPDHVMAQGKTTFDLEHHLNYANEVLVGDTVAVYARMIARTEKRMHYLLFMVNETRSALAATFECINAFVDLDTRRMTPYLPQVAAKLDALIAEHRALLWAAPVSGAMQP